MRVAAVGQGQKQSYRRGRWLPWLAVLLVGCSAEKRPSYQDSSGFSIQAPPGWVERVRGDTLSSSMVHRRASVPLPALDTTGKPGPERLLVRYDRVTSGYAGWLRASVAELPPSVALKTYVAGKTVGPGWKRESEVEELEMSGSPAARLAWVGRWDHIDYVCETVAVRRGEQIYMIAASFPAADTAAREQVRQAVATAVWH